MILQLVHGDFSIYKVKELPKNFVLSDFTFISKTDKELSIISESHLVPDEILNVENDWKCLRIAEDASFDKYGMIAFLANIIAAEKASTLVVGTYDTDYLFIKDALFEQVIEALKGNGCTFLQDN